MAQMNVARTLDDADAAWAAMSPEERKNVEAQLAKGSTPMRAVNLVRSQRRQDAARSGDEAADVLAPPSSGEKAAAAAQGASTRAADALGGASRAAGVNNVLADLIPDIVPKGARKAIAGGGMVLGAPMLPTLAVMGESGLLGDSYKQGRDEQEANSEGVIDRAPGAAGVGQLGVDVVNAGTGLGAVGKNIATTSFKALPALEELLGEGGARGARVAGSRVQGAAKEFARDAAEGEKPTLFNASRRAVKALLAGDGPAHSVPPMKGRVPLDAGAIGDVYTEAPERQGPMANPDAQAREQWLQDVLGDPYGVAGDEAEVGAARTSQVPNDPGTPPSLMEQKPTPATPDWSFGEENLRAGRTPPEAEADIARLRPSGGSTTPAPGTANARKPVTMDDLAEAHAGPAQIDPDVAAEKAAIGRDAANDIATGEMSPRAAGGAARGAARAAAAPKGQPAIRKALDELERNGDPMMKQPSRNLAKIAKRLGIKPGDVKMALDAMLWGR